MVKDRVITLLW